MFFLSRWNTDRLIQPRQSFVPSLPIGHDEHTSIGFLHHHLAG